MKRLLLILAVACVLFCGYYAALEMGKEPETKEVPSTITEKDTNERASDSITEINVTSVTEKNENTESQTEKTTSVIIETILETEAVTENELSDPQKDVRSELKIPILMYHALTKVSEEASSTVITVEKFEEHMAALADAGYTAIFFGDLLDYVKEGKKLPEKPILITFDDGYLSNLTLAGPILDKYGHKATISVVGITAGSSTYKDTGVSIYPHFTFEAAKMAYGSGLFDFQSHTYDMHQNELDEDHRKGMLQKENESEEDYIRAIRDDFFISKSLLESEIGNSCFVIIYPHGKCTPLADSVLAKMGAEISVTVEKGISTVKMGDMSSLRYLCRLNMDDDIGGEELLALVEGKEG